MESRWTAVTGEGVVRLGKEGEGINKKTNKQTINNPPPQNLS